MVFRFSPSKTMVFPFFSHGFPMVFPNEIHRSIQVGVPPKWASRVKVVALSVFTASIGIAMFIDPTQLRGWWVDGFL